VTASADRKRIGVALFGDLTFDSRVRREVAALADAGFAVVVAALVAPPDAKFAGAVTILTIPPSVSGIIPGSANPFKESKRGLPRVFDRMRWLVAYVRGLRDWGRRATAAVGDVDAWHANDLTALFAISPHVPRSTAIVYDSHELFLDTGTALRLPRPARALVGMVEGRLARRAAAVVTVNESLAAVLRRRYRIRAVTAVHNAVDPRPSDAAPSNRLRVAAGIPEGSPVVLYHGALSADRGVEQLMAAMLEAPLAAAHLVLLGYGELAKTYSARARAAAYGGRIHVLDPVSPDELLEWIASADVGAMPIQAATLNLRLSTPNKLFECIAAGTPVVVSDFPAVRTIVRDDPNGPLGAVCNPADVRSIAASINGLLTLQPEDAVSLRRRCLAAAAQRWNWQAQSKRLVRVYRSVLEQHPHDRREGAG
jgi:glycosyltransferase involved in cell wall biosynthesis